MEMQTGSTKNHISQIFFVLAAPMYTWDWLVAPSVADPCHYGMDPNADPDPKIHTSDYQIWMQILEAQKHMDSTDGSGCRSRTLVHLHRSSKIRRHTEVTLSRNQGFSYCFCLMEGSGAKCGFGRPKNLLIRI
jgi:hypothetical protein